MKDFVFGAFISSAIWAIGGLLFIPGYVDKEVIRYVKEARQQFEKEVITFGQGEYQLNKRTGKVDFVNFSDKYLARKHLSFMDDKTFEELWRMQGHGFGEIKKNDK